MRSPSSAGVANGRGHRQGLDVKVKRLEGMQNLNHGLWQGMLVDDVRHKQPKVYRQWQEQPENVCPPEGEMLSEADERVRTAMTKLLKRHKEGVIGLVVSEPWPRWCGSSSSTTSWATSGRPSARRSRLLRRFSEGRAAGVELPGPEQLIMSWHANEPRSEQLEESLEASQAGRARGTLETLPGLPGDDLPQGGGETAGRLPRVRLPLVRLRPATHRGNCSTRGRSRSGTPTWSRPIRWISSTRSPIARSSRRSRSGPG